MSLVIVETAAGQLLSDEVLDDAHQQLSPCIQARKATWRYSLLSVDRQRLICTYDAPDAESVREAYRFYHGSAFASSRAWSGHLIQPEGTPPQQKLALLTVIEESHQPLSEEGWSEINSKTLRCYAEYGLEWIQSYVSLDRTKVIVELNAPDIESIQAVQRKVGRSFDRVWSAKLLSDRSFEMESALSPLERDTQRIAKTPD